MSTVTLLTGGARSGKSRRALELAREYSGKKAFIATAELVDDELRARIERHQAERGGDFATVEEPLDLAGALRALPADTSVAVIDCMTVWLGNLMHHNGEELEPYPEVADFIAAIESPPCDLLIVTNELGMGIIPANPMARRFRDIAGRLNQKLAARADRVLLMVSGLPLTLKGEA
jgi:adenosylcobinamide kinase / adenosylcobinamide-phosphate guanylyltransferase